MDMQNNERRNVFFSQSETSSLLRGRRVKILVTTGGGGGELTEKIQKCLSIQTNNTFIARRASAPKNQPLKTALERKHKIKIFDSCYSNQTKRIKCSSYKMDSLKF